MLRSPGRRAVPPPATELSRCARSWRYQTEEKKMRKLSAFTQVTLDGYFTGIDGDISWAHNARVDAEWNSFVSSNASGGGELLFGRITYEMMASYWPTPDATKN